MTIVASRFLGSAVAMSAGLHRRFDGDFIIQELDALYRRHDLLRRAGRRLLENPASMEYDGLAEVQRALQGVEVHKTIVAGGLVGLTTATLLALRSLGLKIATVFGSLGEAHYARLAAAGVALVDLQVQNKFALFDRLRNLQAEGHLLALRCDASGGSHKYKFLGYDVTCSNLIETYARINACTVVPVDSRLTSEREMTLTCGEPLRGPAETTQTLLAQLESSICRDPVNYAWSSTSLIFSDTQAVRNGLSYLPHIIALREARRRTDETTTVCAAPAAGCLPQA
jgi:hypothetical protein